MEPQQQRLDLCSPGAEVSAAQSTMHLSITSTTGSPVDLIVPRGETVEGLRTRISQKLRLQRNRTVLLHKDRQLTAGKLLDLGVADGSKLTLVPVIEAGLVFSTARAERTMMDVLEGFSENQISDFLSGHSPLTINLGIGAHVMYVQLQLSAQDVKELQQEGNVRGQSSSGLQSGLPTPGSVGHRGYSSALSSTDTTGSATSPAFQTSRPAPESAESTSPNLLTTQKPRTSLNSTAPSSRPCTSVPADNTLNCHHHSTLPHSCPSVRISPSVISTAPLPSGCPHPSGPRQASTLVSSPAPTCSSPRTPSPVPASTFEKSEVIASSAAGPCNQPGAVIESFVSHSPGVYSGTFSGTLVPYSQSGISQPQRGISIILQILTDLFKAAVYHQGAPPTPPQSLCPVNPVLTAEGPSKATGKTLQTQRAEHLSEASGEESCPVRSSTEENQTLHCKLEHLQSLMHQRRLCRRTRRSSQTSHPYQHGPPSSSPLD